MVGTPTLHRNFPLSCHLPTPSPLSISQVWFPLLIWNEIITKLSISQRGDAWEVRTVENGAKFSRHEVLHAPGNVPVDWTWVTWFVSVERRIVFGASQWNLHQWSKSLIKNILLIIAGVLSMLDYKKLLLSFASF